MSTNVPIASITLSAATPSVTFGGIPQTYTDLFIVVNATIDTTNTPSLALRFNNDSSNSYSSTILEGNGASSYSQRYSGNRTMMQFNYYTAYYSNTKNIGILHVQNYSNSNTYKTVLSRWGKVEDSAAGTAASVGLYRANTNAITSISLSPDFGSINWASGSTFNLYGINAANSGQAKATGGNSIYRDSSYWYHVFTSSGTFIPKETLTADYLVVAGGGGGSASGAGAGGLRCTVGATGGGGSLELALSLTAQAYTVTVGAGGAGAANGQVNNGSNGSSSVFSTITSIGGGGGISGASPQLNNGQSGGSGSGGYAGGDGSNTGSVATGGAGTANQGYAGGNSAPKAGSTSSTGGGGGAGAVGGTAPSTDTAGAGGNGVTTSISGTSTTYAGGGGGGIYVNGSAKSGGTGGGGTGSTNNTAGSSGTANTGGGGGGFYSEPYKTAAYSGGSGIVIVRYPV